MGKIRLLDLSVIVVYMATLLALGIRFSKRQTSTERYFVAKRSIPGWAAGLSLLTTLITNVTFVAYPGSAYAGDWSNQVPGFMVLLVLALVGFIIIPFFREVVGVSAYEYFGKRFGYSIRVYSSIGFSATHFLKMGFIFYLLALTVSTMTGWNTQNVIIMVGIITVCYTLVGGIEAVVWADVLQGFVLWAAVLTCLGFLLWLPQGGPAEGLRAAWHNNKISLGSTALNLRTPSILVLSLYGFFYYIQRFAADQTVVQRYLVAKSDRAALRGIALGSILCIPVWTLFMLIGTLCWSYYRSAAEKLPAYVSKADQVFPYFITTHMPPGLAGLLLAALMGAAIANISADLNSFAAVGVEDYYGILRPSATQAQRLRMAKVIVALCGLLCAFVATALSHSRGTALSLWYSTSAIVAFGLAGLFMLAFLTERASNKAAWTGIVSSLLFTAWAAFSLYGGGAANFGWFRFPFHGYMIGVIGHVVLLVTGYAASFLFPNQDPLSKELTLWGWCRRRRGAAVMEVQQVSEE